MIIIDFVGLSKKGIKLLFNEYKIGLNMFFFPSIILNFDCRSSKIWVMVFVPCFVIVSPFGPHYYHSQITVWNLFDISTPSVIIMIKTRIKSIM